MKIEAIKSGALTPIKVLPGSDPVKVGVSNNTKPVTVNIPISPVIIGEEYKGVYNITPKTKDITVLDTEYKTLSKNIVVEKIPYYETSNTSGKSVYIGNEV